MHMAGANWERQPNKPLHSLSYLGNGSETTPLCEEGGGEKELVPELGTSLCHKPGSPGLRHWKKSCMVWSLIVLPQAYVICSWACFAKFQRYLWNDDSELYVTRPYNTFFMSQTYVGWGTCNKRLCPALLVLNSLFKRSWGAGSRDCEPGVIGRYSQA